MADLSKSQVDKLGDRLRKGPISLSDLRMLENYRRSFGEAYEIVMQTLRQHSQSPSGRSAKYTVSIMNKLRREKIRLSQMQDIAGCRVIVANSLEQDKLVTALRAAFTEASVDDLRGDDDELDDDDKSEKNYPHHPSSGYRAIHVKARVLGKLIEVHPVKA